jgi:O-antigen/teichoic acid export membrane protein
LTTPPPPPLPPVLGRLLRGSFWLALRTPLQVLFALWSVPLLLAALKPALNGAYYFALSFGFVQFLLEFGMSSSLQRQVSTAWTRGDRAGVDRAVTCGVTFYAVVAVVQVATLLAIAYGLMPHSEYVPGTRQYQLIVRLLWIQALTAPFFGMSVIVSSVLQAARRYDFVPRMELAIVVLRFLVLLAGLKTGLAIELVVIGMIAVQIGLSLVPALWVMVKELEYVPHLVKAHWADYRAMFHVSLYVFAIQLSVVLADKLDKTVLGFALEDPGPDTSSYEFVSKAFVQIRQTGWMLSYLVMPAAASLAAAHDEAGLERIKYDGSRLLIGLLLPMALLAAIYAQPFLTWWVGPAYAPFAPYMRLFLVATLPLVISVLVQISIGLGKIRVIAIAALLGSMVNLPLSYWLTTQIGMPGVIWGTVLTTLISNLLVPGVYVFRELGVRPAAFLVRTLGPPALGAVVLGAASWALMRIYTPTAAGGGRLMRVVPLAIHIVWGLLAYTAGYALAPAGRADLRALARRMRT